MKKHVALYYSVLRYQDGNLERLKRDFEFIELPDPSYDEDEVLSRVEVLFAPLGYMVGRTKIDRCPALKVIASNTTGHPHIDVEYAKSKGIKIACLKFAQEFLKKITPTAELTFGLVIALTRNIIPAHLSALKGNWDRRSFGANAMMSSMSLGIVGLGRLGSLVAGYAKAFSMKVRYYDPYVDSKDKHFERCKTLKDLVSKSDIISIHVPHELETEGMFDRDIFENFKQGAWLVNTSRGELLDWNALLNALESEHISGAALDVFEGEFDPEFSSKYFDHPLLNYAREHDNLILTQHIGGSTLDAWEKTEAHTIDMVMESLSNIG
jgi:D-3-phosphoglycerate dehydrogenase